MVCNKALEYRHKAYCRRGESIDYNQTSAMLTRWKQTERYAFLNEVSSVPLQQALRYLQQGFSAFFEQQTGYPRFKNKRVVTGSVVYTRSAFTWAAGRLTLAKQSEPLKTRWSRRLPHGAVPSTVTVSRDAAGRRFVSLLVEEDLPTKPHKDTAVGVDAGLTTLFTRSTGEKITDPRHERRDRARIRRRQKDLSRKAKDSKNRAEAQVKLARAHARIADRRRDFLHKCTTRLVNEDRVIAVEDLNVRGMLADRRPARAIADASWAEFRRMLEYKAEWYGRTLVAVDRFPPSSKTCSACGTMKDTMPLAERVFECATCGHTEDRDVKSAKNILAAGPAVTACGDGMGHEPS